MEGYSFVVALLLSSFFFSEACNKGLLEDVDFPGADITFLFSPSVEHCQNLCTQHPECLFFSFIRPDCTRDNRHFQCFLKSTPSGQPLTQTPLPGVTSGFSLKSCVPDPRPCFSQVFPNVDFPGGDYRALFTLDHEECQRACTQDPGCQFFSFITAEYIDRTFRQKCHLKFSWSIPTTPIVEKTTGVTSGFAQKARQTQEFDTVCPIQFFPNTNIPGSDLEELRSVSTEHCQVLCSAHPKCSYFSFSSNDFKCFLKNNFEGLVAQPTDGFTSGIAARFCELDDTWVKLMYEGVDFRGSDIRNELVDSAELCQQKCDEDPNCQFYAYTGDDFSDREFRRRCILKRVITMPAPPNVKKLPNVVSGFSLRNCNRVAV